MATEMHNPWIHEAQIPGRVLNLPADRTKGKPGAPTPSPAVPPSTAPLPSLSAKVVRRGA